MFTFNGSCPHCQSNRGFVAFGVSSHVIREKDYATIPAAHRETEIRVDKENPYIFYSLAGECLTCKKPVVASCASRRKGMEEIRTYLADPFRRIQQKIEVTEIFPKIELEYSHPSLPQKVNLSFVDLQKMLKAGMQPHFIISGCRSVLENSLNALGAEGKTIYAKIENLYSKNQITETLKDWAHIIRDNGNEAVHELGGTQEQAEELVNFTRIFLQYTFEMPAKIAAMRKK